MSEPRNLLISHTEGWPSWFKAPVLKIGVRLTVDREFESRPLRQLSNFELRISMLGGSDHSADHAHRTVTSYGCIAESCVTNVSPSTRAWAMSIRSNGSA